MGIRLGIICGRYHWHFLLLLWIRHCRLLRTALLSIGLRRIGLLWIWMLLWLWIYIGGGWYCAEYGGGCLCCVIDSCNVATITVLFEHVNCYCNRWYNPKPPIALACLLMEQKITPHTTKYCYYDDEEQNSTNCASSSCSTNKKHNHKFELIIVKQWNYAFNYFSSNH